MGESGVTFPNFNSFRDTLRRYSKYTKRSLPTILDTKAFYICRGAARLTMSANKSKIRSSLMAPAKIAPDAPIIALMVNQRRGEKGLKGLYGKDMKVAVAVILNARIRSRGFIASGWIPAIKTLEKYAERKGNAPRVSSAIKQYGRAKGSAQPATGSGSWNVSTIITNAASTNRDLKEALALYGLPAFIEAWDDEIASMEQYILDHQTKIAQQHGLHP